MVKNDATQLCYLVILALSIGFIVWGFMDLLKKKQPEEKDTTDVISRQIRGFALIMIAQVVLLFGGALCFGMAGGLDGLGKMVAKISK